MSAVRILILEDEITGLPDVLRGSGFEVQHARSFAEAAKLLAGEPFDAALVDLMIPADDVITGSGPAWSNGLTFLQRLRRGELPSVRPDLPIVVLSAACDVTVLRRIDALGVSARMEKPVKIEHIRAALHAAARRS